MKYIEEETEESWDREREREREREEGREGEMCPKRNRWRSVLRGIAGERVQEREG